MLEGEDGRPLTQALAPPAAAASSRVRAAMKVERARIMLRTGYGALRGAGSPARSVARARARAASRAARACG